MLPDTGEGPRVPAAEQRLDAADEPCLLLQAPPGDDEGPVVRQGLLFELLQSIRSEVDARGLKEGGFRFSRSYPTATRNSRRPHVNLAQKLQQSPSRWHGGTDRRR
jgi:hypothetical protein